MKEPEEFKQLRIVGPSDGVRWIIVGVMFAVSLYYGITKFLPVIIFSVVILVVAICGIIASGKNKYLLTDSELIIKEFGAKKEQQ